MVRLAPCARQRERKGGFVTPAIGARIIGVSSVMGPSVTGCRRGDGGEAVVVDDGAEAGRAAMGLMKHVILVRD